MNANANLHKLMKSAVVEKDVEAAWRAAITSARPHAQVSSPVGCDGLFVWGETRMLAEFKFDFDMRSRAEVARVLGQVAGYLKRLESTGSPLPNVVMIADRNECTLAPVAVLLGFIACDFDWSIAPSTGDPQLVAAIEAPVARALHCRVGGAPGRTQAARRQAAARRLRLWLPASLIVTPAAA